MPSFGASKTPEDCHRLKLKREAYRKKLIAKGVIDGSKKMLSLMCRKGL